MTVVAAVDCGTNSVRLLVAHVPDGSAAGERGELRDLAREIRITRLGEGVDRTGRFDPAAVARTLEALRDYAAEIRDLGAKQVRMVATSATRDAANREIFVDGVHDILGVEPEVVTGAEEGQLSFLGATRELYGRPGAETPFLVVDIGGGSTELVIGTESAEHMISVDIGCVRMTERHLAGDPPAEAEIAAAVRDIDAGIEAASRTVPLSSARTLVGLAGSVTTVAAIALGLPAYISERIHGSRLSRHTVHEIAWMLLAMPREKRAALPPMHPGRVDVIAAGALILDRVMDLAGCAEVLVSEHDILDGIAWELARR